MKNEKYGFTVNKNMFNFKTLEGSFILIELTSKTLDFQENEALYHAIKSVKSSYGEKVSGIIIDMSAVEEVPSYNYLLRMEQEFCAESRCRLGLVLRSESQPQKLHGQLGLQNLFPAASGVEEALNIIKSKLEHKQ